EPAHGTSFDEFGLKNSLTLTLTSSTFLLSTTDATVSPVTARNGIEVYVGLANPLPGAVYCLSSGAIELSSPTKASRVAPGVLKAPYWQVVRSGRFGSVGSSPQHWAICRKFSPPFAWLGGVECLAPVQLTVTPCEIRFVVCDTVTASPGKGESATSASCCAAVAVTARLSSARAGEPVLPHAERAS